MPAPLPTGPLTLQRDPGSSADEALAGRFDAIDDEVIRGIGRLRRRAESMRRDAWLETSTTEPRHADARRTVRRSEHRPAA